MQVLIADDDALSRRILEDCLQNWGYEVVVTSNGLEAWAVLQEEQRPSLAILDWMMPGMDGVDICARLRKLSIPGYVYTILLTARNQHEDIIKGLESGADDYIIKPFNQEELKSRLKIGRRITELEQRIRRMARTDYLTGLLNRRAFMECLEGEICRSYREQRTLGIVIMDIDHFKRVNDNFGHYAGDVVLQELSQLLVKTCRTYDFVGRYGGEEFIICLPGAGRLETCEVAERLRQRVEQEKIHLPEHQGSVSVTASFGLACLSASQMKDADQLIREADDALYAAKGAGRNQVVLSSKSEE